MSDIPPLPMGHWFDDDSVRVLGQAFDAATRRLHDADQPAAVREIIAGRIIHLAGTGEHDPEHLARRALEQLGIVPKA